jgi:hypothetical protein
LYCYNLYQRIGWKRDEVTEAFTDGQMDREKAGFADTTGQAIDRDYQI